MKVTAIFGPPGTGKTRTLVDLAKQEANADAPALFLSFTKAAAAEAVSRLPNASFIRTSTLHSMAFNALSMNRAAVVDRRKLYEFGKLTGFPFKGSESGSDELQEGDEFSGVLQFANNQQMDPELAYNRCGAPGTTAARFAMFVKAYQSWKKTNGYMDFDDMLIQFCESNWRDTNNEIVFLDEAQDCSPLQWRVFNKVVSGAKRVYISGDDDQAIYEWSGADPHGMINFTNQRHGEVKVLNQSYRVPHLAYRLATKHVLDNITQRVAKTFRPTAAMGKVLHYGDFINIDLPRWNDDGGGLILVRDNWRLEEVKKHLNRELIPYNVLGGQSPWTSKIAAQLREGGSPEIPPAWQNFYRQANLTLPIKINLSTIHQAKGREAERVILDLELSTKVLAGLYLNRDAELRVLYVALTRTSNELLMCGGNPLI